jgi:hypothetical protein
MLARIPRSRGMLSGLLLVLLGLWGGLIPLAGPYFGIAYTPGRAWDYTPGRLLLEILPAAGAILGGLIMLVTASRPMAYIGGLLAAASGAWYIFGGMIAQVWTPAPASWTGVPVGGPLRQAAERIGFFYGPGAGIIFFAALALGRFAVVGVREAREARTAESPPYILGLTSPQPTQATPAPGPAKKQRAPA